MTMNLHNTKDILLVLRRMHELIDGKTDRQLIYLLKNRGLEMANKEQKRELPKKKSSAGLSIKEKRKLKQQKRDERRLKDII